MSLAVVLAAPGLPQEAQLIAVAPSHGIDVRRRCVDAADLLGACMGAPGLLAVITASLPRLSAEVMTRLRESGSHIIGIVNCADDRVRLEQLGVDVLLESSGGPHDLLSSIARVLRPEEAVSGVWTIDREAPFSVQEPGRGRLLAVWGPAGAPGRTTTALLLAESLAERGRTAIIDADTAAPSLALQLGLAEDVSGIILACRHAELGSLTNRTITSSMSKLTEHYFALTGLADARRWPELRPTALGRIFDQVRRDFSYAVVDIGASFDADSTAMPSRSSAANSALAAADVVVAVCHAEPLGVARFLGDFPELAALGLPIVAVITGGSQHDQTRQLILEAGGRLGLTFPVADLGMDARSLRKTLLRGSVVGAGRPFVKKSRPAARLVDLVA